MRVLFYQSIPQGDLAFSKGEDFLGEVAFLSWDLEDG